MSEIERMAVQAALRKMFSSSYFDICTVDKCLKLLNIPQGGKTYQLLSTLHCVNFTDMDRELVKAVPGMVGEVLQGFALDVSEAIREPEPVTQPAEVVESTPRRGILRMLGRG